MCIGCWMSRMLFAHVSRTLLENDARIERENKQWIRIEVNHYKCMQRAAGEKCIDFIIAANAERRSLNSTVHTAHILNGDDGDYALRLLYI